MSDFDNGEEEEEELKDLLRYDAEVKKEEEKEEELEGEVRLPRFDRLAALEIEEIVGEEEIQSQSRMKMNVCSMFTVLLVFTCMVLIIVYMWEYTELSFGEARNASNASVSGTALTFFSTISMMGVESERSI